MYTEGTASRPPTAQGLADIGVQPGSAEPPFKLCGSSRANCFDRIALALESERTEQFQIGQYLNPLCGAEASHFFREEIRIAGTDDVGVSGQRCTEHGFSAGFLSSFSGTGSGWTRVKTRRGGSRSAPPERFFFSVKDASAYTTSSTATGMRLPFSEE
jgi:hypothetical protein